MARKKEPESIEWIVTGRALMIGATCIVHARTRTEAIAKAATGETIGEVELDGASVADFSGSRAEPNV